MRGLLAASIAIGLAGCTVLSGVADLSVGDDDAGLALDGAATADGSLTPIADSALPNETGSLVDAATSGPDASADAKPDVIVVGQKPFCQLDPTHVACFDFEDQKIPAGYTQEVAATTWSVDAPGSSSSYALHGLVADGSAGTALFRVPLVGVVTTASWAFDVDLSASSNQIEFMALNFKRNDGTSCSFQPTFSAGSIQVNEYCPGQGAPDQVNHDITPAEVGAGWHHIQVIVAFNAKSFAVNVTKPSGAKGELAKIPLDARFVSGTSELWVGVSFAVARTPGANLRLDNVTLDYQ